MIRPTVICDSNINGEIIFGLPSKRKIVCHKCHSSDTNAFAFLFTHDDTDWRMHQCNKCKTIFYSAELSTNRNNLTPKERKVIEKRVHRKMVE